MSTIPLAKGFSEKHLKFPVFLSHKIDGVPVRIDIDTRGCFTARSRQNKPVPSVSTLVQDFLDDALGWPGSDVHCPAPQNFRYKDQSGRERFYIPDVYIESLNLIIEVKGEMHNGYRSRDIEIERTKDTVLETSGYAYVKLEDRSYADLLDGLAYAKLKAERDSS